ncbi:hypothetical protein [Roseivirga sp. UBA1976]|uniref:hypothetical protein n=1 Tax=Roseivirga sp. UBA1976 TaxID=1947386 RepID=UPI00257C40F9|nr:hypothetical protein [Roseivirga sp. UBA1976]|tara:strand:+ start:8721 stop:9275 length:555 start_codon:yes stop_codon:yes gene_type:complete
MIDNINKVNWENPDPVISYFEENQIQVLNHIWGISSQDFENLKFCVHYINALYQKAHYSKCMEFIEKTESAVSRIDNHDLDDLKRQILFVKGMILNRTKKYKEAEALFIKLEKEDPDHHYYSQWRINSKSKRYSWLITACYILVAIFYLADVVFDPAGFSLILTAFILFILAFSLPYILKKYLK